MRTLWPARQGCQGATFQPQTIQISFNKLCYNYILVYLIFCYHFGWSSRKLFIWQHWPGHFAPRHVPPHGKNMFNFRYEDGFKINNNYFLAITRILYLSTETISKPPQSHETIPFNHIIFMIMYLVLDVKYIMLTKIHGSPFVWVSLAIFTFLQFHLQVIWEFQF
jgi:hypothetical protein